MASLSIFFLANPLPLIITPPPHPPNNKYSPDMVYYNMLGIFIIRGLGGLIIRGRGFMLLGTLFARDPKRSTVPLIGFAGS